MKMYKHIYTKDIIFDDSSDVCTTYLGKTDRSRKHFMKAQEQF